MGFGVWISPLQFLSIMFLDKLLSLSEPEFPGHDDKSLTRIHV
jgi:hypothetical protein